MPLCYEDSFRVYQFECDPWDAMTPGAVLRRVQEIATMQCESLGVNEELYKRTHTVFLLSRLSLDYYKAPAIEQQVRIETRAYGMHRAAFHRVTSLYSATGGEKLCEADTRWVLVDTAARRILRRPPEEFDHIFRDEAIAEAHDLTLPKPETPPEGLAKLEARYSLCDRNGHVNNTRYADLMCDYLPPERLKAGPPRRMLLHYHAEIPMGESFELLGAPMGERGWYFLAKQPESNNFEGYAEFFD